MTQWRLSALGIGRLRDRPLGPMNDGLPCLTVSRWPRHPSGASRHFFPSKAKSRRSTIRNVVLGPSVGRQAGSRTIDAWSFSLCQQIWSRSLRRFTSVDQQVGEVAVARNASRIPKDRIKEVSPCA